MSRSRFLAIAGLELRDCSTRPLFLLFLASLAVVTASLNPAALIPSGDPSGGGVRPFVNTPFAMANVFALSGVLLYGFFAAILAGFCVIRDDEHKVNDLLHGTPLTAAEYVLGKFAGVLTAVGGALSLQVVFAIGVHQLMPAGNPDAIRGAFRLASFVVPALAFTAPLIGFAAGLAFAVGERTRKPLLVAAVPIAIFLACVFFLWRWTPAWLDPRIDRLLMIVDPSGLRWLQRTLFEVDRGVDFYNTASLPFDMTFFWNRLLALAVPALAVGASIRHCQVTAAGGGYSGRAGSIPAEAAHAVAERPARLESLGMTTAAPRFVASTLQLARAEFRELRAHPALYVFAPLVMLMVWEYSASATGSLDSPMLMTAGTLAVGALERIGIPVCLLLLFYTVESAHRERTTRFDVILHATPVRTSALLLSKGLANAAVVVVILAGCGASGLTILALQEQGRVEVWPLVLVWGLVIPPTFVVWSTFVMAVHAIVRDRYTTYAIGLLVLIASAWHHTRDSMTWVHNWDLWGTLRWSDMGPFDLDGRALAQNRGLVMALAVFLAAVAVRSFTRTERDPARTLDRLAPGQIPRAAAWLVPFALPSIVLGALLALEVGDGFQGGDASDRAREYWRRNVATWRDFEPATVTHLDLAIDLEPARRHLEVTGTFTMVNLTDETMRRLAFTVGPAFERVSWSLDGSGVVAEDRSGLHVLDLPEPAMPGATFRVSFAYAATFPRGVTRNGGGISEFVLPSGVLLHTLGPNLVPLVGFLPEIGAERFEPRQVAEDFWKATLPPAGRMPLPFTTRIEATAPDDYTVNSVGVRTFAATRGGRTTVVWESDYPVRAVSVVAGRWDVRRREGAAVFHHPGHPYNVDAIVDTLVAARRKYSEWFYPYPWADLRLNQFPDQVDNAKGFATNIAFSEGIGFLAKSDPRTPLAFVVTAHEAAHQWWGNLLMPGEGPGADVLIEGMAHYSTLLLMESERGLEDRIAFAKRLEQSYIEDRRLDAERPLTRVGDDGRPGDETVIFDKGAWVMWMLHNHLGRERALAGLREFFNRYIDNPDHPALADLIETLRPYAADPQAYQDFVDQWFHDVVLPEFRLESAAVKRTGTRWEVSATVENVGTGVTEVEIAATHGERFAEADPHGYRDARVVQRLEPGRPAQVTWVVDFKPQRLVVDPDALVLQSNRDRGEAIVSVLQPE